MNNVVQKHMHGSTAVKIAASVEEAVRHGHLVAGTKLPPVRVAAAMLGVAPATVASAYQTLKSRGIVICDGRRGSRISPRTVLSSACCLPPPVPAGVRNLRDGNPDPALLPDMARALREIDPSPGLYGLARNDEQLIKIASADFEADGVPRGPISVVNGALDGIERVLREHLRPGDRVAVEDPGFGTIVDLVTSLGLTPVPIEVDDDGPIPDALARALAQRTQALILMPRGQNPTGAALTESRARELRRLLCRAPDTLVIEDDHINYIADVPLVSVIDAKLTRWAMVRSLSKAINPDLRLALLTGDDRTMARVEDRLIVGERWVSHILQRIGAWLLSNQSVRRDLAKAAATYAARRNALVSALRERGIEAFGHSGLNVWIPVREETPVVQFMMQRGWAISAGERFRLAAPPAVRVTISTLLPEDAPRLADDLAMALGTHDRTSVA